MHNQEFIYALPEPFQKLSIINYLPFSRCYTQIPFCKKRVGLYTGKACRSQQCAQLFTGIDFHTADSFRPLKLNN